MRYLNCVCVWACPYCYPSVLCHSLPVVFSAITYSSCNLPCPCPPCTGEYLSIQVTVSSSEWPSTKRFPCPSSQLAPDANVCDYAIHGYQTVPGNPRERRGRTGAGDPGVLPRGRHIPEPAMPTGLQRGRRSQCVWHVLILCECCVNERSAFCLYVCVCADRPRHVILCHGSTRPCILG